MPEESTGNAEPMFETRTVHLPDGGRIIIAHKAGALDHLTDAEIILRDRKRRLQWEAEEAGEEAVTEGTVTDLAAERFLRRPPGTPFEASE